jgi:hypothetical protein
MKQLLKKILRFLIHGTELKEGQSFVKLSSNA